MVILDMVVLLMAEILHQLIGSLSHYLQGLYIPGGAGFLPSTVVVDFYRLRFVFFFAHSEHQKKIGLFLDATPGHGDHIC